MRRGAYQGVLNDPFHVDPGSGEAPTITLAQGILHSPTTNPLESEALVHKHLGYVGVFAWSWDRLDTRQPPHGAVMMLLFSLGWWVRFPERSPFYWTDSTSPRSGASRSKHYWNRWYTLVHHTVVHPPRSTVCKAIPLRLATESGSGLATEHRNSVTSPFVEKRTEKGAVEAPCEGLSPKIV